MHQKSGCSYQENRETMQQRVTRILIILIMILCHFGGTVISIWTDAILYLIFISISLLSAVVFWKHRLTLRITMPEILLLLFLTYLMITNGTKGTLLGNERLLNLFRSIMLYFPLSILYKRDKELPRYLIYGILFTGLLEAFEKDAIY